MSSEIRFGVIGVGSRGGLAALAHKPDDECRIVAGADVNDQFLAEFAHRYQGTFVTKDYRELLQRKDVDAVFVTTPDFLHEEHAIAAMRAGKHVYLEKPMAITIDGCDRILHEAIKAGVKLYLGHNMRHFTVIKTMKRLIDEGAIGQVQTAWCRHFVSYGADAYYKDWHAERTTATGLLLQKGAHDIDVLHWLCGSYSRRVTAMGSLMVYGRCEGKTSPEQYNRQAARAQWTSIWPPLKQTNLNPHMDVEDVSMMLMELDNGVLASYQQCHFTPDAWRNYTVIGTEGRIENFGDSPGNSWIHLWDTRRDEYRPAGDRVIEIPKEEGGHGGADPVIIRDFIQYLRGGRPGTSAVAARYSVAAGCIATQSLRNGSMPMDVPAVADDVRRYFE